MNLFSVFQLLHKNCCKVRKKQVHFPSFFIAWLGFSPFAFAFMQESESENRVIRYCRPYSSASSSTFLRGAINHIENTLFSNLPSLSSSSPALSHYNIYPLQTSKYNHHYLRCAINHIENTPFSNLHPYPHHHLHYIIIIFPTIKPQNTTTIISDVQLITKKTTSSTSIFINDHPFLPTTIQPQNTIISSFSSSFKILSSVQKVGWLEGVNLDTAIL